MSIVVTKLQNELVNASYIIVNLLSQCDKRILSCKDYPSLIILKFDTYISWKLEYLEKL